MVFTRHRGKLEVSERERQYLQYEATYEEFDEWITQGRVPPEVLDGPIIEVETLEGLVDVAIDTNARVIESQSGNRFVVTVDGVVYSFTAPPEPTAQLPAGESDEPAVPSATDDIQKRSQVDTDGQGFDWES